MKYLIVFIAALVNDWVWTAYIVAASNKSAAKAMAFSGLIMLIGAFITLSYMDDVWSLAVAIAGGMLGTYLSVKYSK